MSILRWSYVLAAAFAVSSAERATAQCNAFDFTQSFAPTGAGPVSVAFGDFNGDGRLDLCAVDPNDETVALLFGLGSAAFAPAVIVPAGRVPRAVASGDFDRDGDLDVAVANEGYVDVSGWHEVGITVLWNDGSGVFASSSFTPLPLGEIQPTDVAAADFNHDGALDLAVTLKGSGTLHSKLAAFVNDGAGHFAPATLAATGYGPIALALGDIDGDGTIDAVTVNALADSMSVLHGNGDGTFTPIFGHSVGVNPMDVALGDFDGDGRVDAAIAYRYGVHLLRNVNGTLTWIATLPAGFFPEGVAFADLNGDHALDLAAVDYLGGQAFVWTGDGHGLFTPKLQFAVGSAPVTIDAADLDGDGDPDLAVTIGPPGGVIVLRNVCALCEYCVAKPNSLGCSPAISSSGTPSLSGPDDFHVLAAQELNHKTGVAFFGTHAASLPFAGGTLCVKPPLVRTNAQDSGGTSSGSDCTGTYDWHAANAWIAAHGWTAGQDLFVQYWSRDPQSPDGTGIALSDALRFLLQP